MLQTVRRLFSVKKKESTMASPPISEITVDPLFDDPNKACTASGRHIKVKVKTPMNPWTPISDDHVRFVCISDTHCRIEKKPPDFVPPGDVLLHAGDFTEFGAARNVEKFNAYLGKLPHKHKIVIAGNHELSFDEDIVNSEDFDGFSIMKKTTHDKYLKDHGLSHITELLSNCTYLQDSTIQVYGINIYGSPWQPEFCDWAFNLPRGQECLDKWNMIPDSTDVLMTHGPPVGYGDLCTSGSHAGCVDLLNTVQRRVKPAYHVFGHIHEGYGMYTDGVTTYINPSTCNRRYQAENTPIVFDYPLPKGHTKMKYH